VPAQLLGKWEFVHPGDSRDKMVVTFALSGTCRIERIEDGVHAEVSECAYSINGNQIETKVQTFTYDENNGRLWTQDGEQMKRLPGVEPPAHGSR